MSIEIGDGGLGYIYLGDVLIAGGGGGGESGWKPGANTLAYYPFINDTNDHSGNNVILTIGGTSTKSTIGYTITKDAGISTNIQAKYLGQWVCINDKNSYYGMICGMNSASRGFQARHRESAFDNKFFVWYSSSSSVKSGSTGIGTGSRHHIACVLDGSNHNFYIDGSLFWTTTYNHYDTSNNYSLIASWGGNANASFTLSESIFESEPRTATEISNYYNQTKSKYGL